MIKRDFRILINIQNDESFLLGFHKTNIIDYHNPILTFFENEFDSFNARVIEIWLLYLLPLQRYRYGPIFF